MNKKAWLIVGLGAVFTAGLFAASCSKQVTQTRVEPAAAQTPMAEPEVPKVPDTSAGEDRQLMERLQAEAAAREAAESVFVTENVHFAFDSSLLSGRARRVLMSKADYLRTNPDILITIEGHCDDRGSNAYNNALGERRAESVKIYLVDLGIDANRLSTVSFGEKRPISAGHDEKSWAMNRRAQFVIN